MRRYSSLLLNAGLGILAISAAISAAEPSVDPKLRAAFHSGRSPENKALDQDRHPLQTLTFFGIQPSMTVVEMWPFGGWYTEILAPYLRDHGKLYAAAMDPASTDGGELKYNSDLKELFAKRPQLFDKVQLSVLSPARMQLAPDGTADMALNFRTNYNWLWAGSEKEVFAAAFRALKPGGILGVVEYRSNDPNAAPDEIPGYVGEQYAINLIESVGFQFAGGSDINRNPRDTKDYPKGAWSLPPYYADGHDKFTDLAALPMSPNSSGRASSADNVPVGGMKSYMHIRTADPATDRRKYPAIGEADRFTLKFIKPES
jgi:predicted methyltransferase